MENKTDYSYMLDDDLLNIDDGGAVSFGGNQHWFPLETQSRSGCGPVVAAMITAYLALAFPNKYSALYPYHGRLNKEDFLAHMLEIRKYVIPGNRGLTSVRQFALQTTQFAYSREIHLMPRLLDDSAIGFDKAAAFISRALSQNLPVAVLILTHPSEELLEYTWHWMTVTGLKYDAASGSYTITVSTYGQRREINLELLWNHRTTDDIINLAYFI
ncbi:MAG: hypothetical protein RBT41_09380 [Clostridia bacterium]|nr:hypothetical protein [Clostridia bacterium]